MGACTIAPGMRSLRQTSRLPRSYGALVSAVLVLLTAPAWPRSIVAAPTGGTANIDRAREQATMGLELYDGGRYAEALERFLRADALYPAPQNKVYAARCQVKLGRWMDGLRLYDQVVDEVLAPDAPASFTEARQIATDERAVLKVRIPTLTVVLKGDGATTILLNGALTNLSDLYERPIDPGAHTLVVRRAGIPDEVRSIELREAERRRIELSTREATPEPSRVDDDVGPQVGIGLLFGVGGASLVTATVTGIVAVIGVEDLKARCTPDGQCPRADRHEAAEVETVGNVSTALFVIGGVAAAAGLVWVLVDANDDSSVRVAVSPGFLSLASSF